MARVIKKTIRTRQKADKFYPETLAKYVKTTDGKSVEEALETVEEVLEGVSVDIVTTISSSSTDEQVPSAKCLYTTIGNIESLLAAI